MRDNTIVTEYAVVTSDTFGIKAILSSMQSPVELISEYSITMTTPLSFAPNDSCTEINVCVKNILSSRMVDCDF